MPTLRRRINSDAFFHLRIRNFHRSGAGSDARRLYHRHAQLALDFFINLPIGILSLILTSLFVKESKEAEESTREFRKGGKTIDWMGIILFVTGIATLELLLSEGPKEGWLESNFILLILAYTVISLLVGITWEYYQKNRQWIF